MNGSSSCKFNPNAGSFQPSAGARRGTHAPQRANMSHANGDKVSEPLHHPLERRVHGVEHEQRALRTEVEDLKTLWISLQSSVEMMKKGGISVSGGPSQNQSAAQLKRELDAITEEAKSTYSCKVANGPEQQPALTAAVSPKAFQSVPPHMRGKNGTKQESVSLPPHLRGIGSPTKSISSSKALSVRSPLATDGIVETTSRAPSQAPLAAQTPPASIPGSPATIVEPEHTAHAIRSLSLGASKHWVPHYITTLPPISTMNLREIPALTNMTTFHPDFLRNTFSGITWGPGLNFIPPTPGPCILRNRTYYTVDSTYEPYLPFQPGMHGAKLTAFFNNPPEETYELPEGCSSTEDVPLFVLRQDEQGRQRYVYYGHYTQSRWSDKLDYDRMVACVPAHVKNYWAEELSAVGRPEWVTEALMKHFFPKPEYEGRLFGAAEDGSVTSQESLVAEDKVLKDVKKYVKQLRFWEKDARIRVSMIKKDFLLKAFETPDAEEPVGLRLWWEYLQCLRWDPQFCDMLETLQGRHECYL